MIANYRVQAELTAVESTADGKAVVLGTIDGCISVLVIVDTEKKDMGQYLTTMPSRDEEVNDFVSIFYQLLFIASGQCYTYKFHLSCLQ